MKRILSTLLALSMIASLCTPVYAAETSGANDGFPLSEGLVEYLATDKDELLMNPNNYGYMVLAENLSSNATSSVLMHSADELTGTGLTPGQEEYTRVLTDLMISYEMYQTESLSAQYADATEALTHSQAEFDNLLAFIEEHADEELKTAASNLRTNMKTALELKLETCAPSSGTDPQAVNGQFLTDDFISSLMETEEYSQNEAFRSFVLCALFSRTNASYVRAFTESGSSQDPLPLVYVNQPGKDLMKRLQELTAFYEISCILQTQLSDLASEFSSQSPSADSEDIAEKYNFYSDFLIMCRIHGEYYLYSIAALNEDLLSWLGVQNIEEAKQWCSQKYSKIKEIETELEKAQAPGIDYENLVTDAYSKTLESSGKTLSFQIPEIHLDSPEVEQINNDIYTTMMAYVEEAETLDIYSLTCGNASYEWTTCGDILSLIIKYDMYPFTDAYSAYSIYNIHLTTGTQLNTETFLQLYGMSKEEYYETAKMALGSYWWDMYYDFTTQENLSDTLIKIAQEQLTTTMSTDNIDGAKPYINANGDLCIICRIYTMAGANSTPFSINLAHFELSPYYSETIPSATAPAAVTPETAAPTPETATPTPETAAPSVTISEEEARAIAESYWNFHEGDIAEETGFPLGVQMQDSPPSSDEYRFALRWLVDNSHWSTLDAIYINPTTGECRSAY